MRLFVFLLLLILKYRQRMRNHLEDVSLKIKEHGQQLQKCG